MVLLGELGKVTAVSAPMESEPWGFESANRFTNIGVNLRTELTARELLTGLQAIERRLDPEGAHRNPDGSYRDRQLDLDLIAFGSETSDDPDCTLPHPRMHLREFVLRPMVEVWPEWRHPVLRLSAAQLLQELSNNTAPESVK